MSAIFTSVRQGLMSFTENVRSAAQRKTHSLGTALRQTMTFKTRSSDIECEATYPEENPKDFVQDITRVLAHVGVFEGIKENPTYI